ncbi:MAG: alpha-L-arabinofuranosidase C-terminal domain-containing protein [Atribacterota bacterium]
MNAHVKVWGVKAGDISPLIYGHFIEHLGRCIYGGVFDEDSPLSDARGFRRDVLEAVKKIKCPILRWPGGNFASAYHWEDGVGPKEARPQLLNYIWGGIESNRFGTDEFIEYCREIGAEPYIAVSLGTGTLDEALHWLEYCNLDTPTKYATMRKKLGHPEPYRVTYWGIGNEVYGPWQVGHCSAQEYAEKLRQFATFMKYLDPSIKIIAVGADDPDWDLTVLRHAGKVIDFISIHQYHGSEDYYETVAAAYYVEERLKLLASLIKSTRMEHVKIAFDEWNIWYQVDPEKEAQEKGVVYLEEPYALKDALFAAGIFCVLHRLSDVVGMANLAQMVNALGMIKTQKNALVLTPIYHVFDLFVNHTGSVRLGHEVYTEYYAIRAKSFLGGRSSFALEHVPYFDVSTTYDVARNVLAIAMVNFHKEESCEVVLDLSDLPAAKEATLFALTGDIYAENDFVHPNRVVPVSSRVPLSPSFSLPPHALWIVEIPLEKKIL